MTANADNYNNAQPFYTGYGQAAAPTAQNPPIVPPMGTAIGTPPNAGESSGDTSVALQSAAQVLAQFPRVAASGTVTLTGSVTEGDTCYIELANGTLPGGVLQVSALAGAADTLATIAETLTALLNTNPTLAALGVTAGYSVVGSDPTITINWPGQVGNYTAVAAWSYLNLETATIGGSETDGDVLTLTVTGGLVANSGTIVVGGTVTTGDIVSVSIENAILAGGKSTYSYTTLGGDTVTDIAEALIDLIQADTALAPLNLQVNQVAGEIFLSWVSTLGPVFLSGSVVGVTGTTLAFAYQAGNPPSALAPSPAPSELITVGGSPITGETVSLTVVSPDLSAVTVSYVVQGGDDTSDVAEGLAAAINADVQLIAGAFVAVPTTNTLTVQWMAAIGGVAFTGLVTAAPTETLTTNVAPAAISVSHTTAGSESLTAIATALTALLNANVILTASAFLATSSGAVISIFYSGAFGKPAFSKTLSGGASETITLANASGARTIGLTGSGTIGDYVMAKFVSEQFPAPVIVQIQAASTTLSVQATALAAAINSNEELASGGISATASSAVVTIAVAPGEPLPTFSAYSNGVEIATITGTPTATELPVLRVTDSGLVGGHVDLTHTVTLTDTNATIAAAFAALVNANTALAALGITATAASNVVHVTSKSLNATTYSRTNSANTTITLTGGPTETFSITNAEGTETLTPTTPLANGSGAIIPLSDFTWSAATDVQNTAGGNGSLPAVDSPAVSYFYAGKPVPSFDYNTLAAMVAQGMPIM